MIKLSRKWLGKEDGAAAIEFSLLVWPFVMMTLAIIELSLMFASESLLEGAVSQASRQIKTGQLQQSGAEDMEAAFRTLLCDEMPALLDCSEVLVEAQTMTNFSDFDDMAPTFDEDGTFQSSGFAVGGSDERVLVRVAYYYPAMTPILLPMFPFAGNTRLMMSTVVMQTEPYDFGEASGEGSS